MRPKFGTKYDPTWRPETTQTRPRKTTHVFKNSVVWKYGNDNSDFWSDVWELGVLWYDLEDVWGHMWRMLREMLGVDFMQFGMFLDDC